METLNPSRRHDLDWLRVIAFGSLILYHIGMFYVTWDFHVKSVYSGTTFEPAMKLLNPWRLSLLFLISGIALRFSVDKLDLIMLARQRSIRLILPIFFGIFVIVAPQAWLELIEKGETSVSFVDFYLQYIKASPDFSIIVPTWNHLWYVVYIFVYTLVLLTIVKPLRRIMTDRGESILNLLLERNYGVLLLLILPISIFYSHHFLLRPIFHSSHALVDDWANHQLFFSLFLMGFLVAKNASFWRAIERSLKPSIMLVLLLSLTSCTVWYLESLNLKSDYLVIAEFFSERFRKTAFAWFSIIAALAIAQRWLNKPSIFLTYMNQSIFSWYIIHQTLIIVFGYWLTRQDLSFFLEIVLLSLSTYLGCFVLHEYFIRRTKWLRPMFGMKVNA